jgi:hypothetical protein
MKRSIRFGLLLNAAEKQMLARLAEAEGGLSQGAMLRNLIRKEVSVRGLQWSQGQGGRGVWERDNRQSHNSRQEGETPT